MGKKIDAVVTWVDGNRADFKDQVIAESKAAHLVKPTCPTDPSKSEVVDYEQRFVSGIEIVLCIESLIRFGTAIDHIYIVTNGQNPLTKYPHLKRHADRITLIDHKTIFCDYPDALPTFSSTAISALLWKIPDISPYFMYFNDDCMLWSN